MKKNNLAGKTALITGASGGMGAEFARLFASDRVNLILVARSMDKLSSLKEELESSFGITVTLLEQDLSLVDSARNVFDFITSRNFHIDFLVNNAGFGDFALFAESDFDKIQQMIRLNVQTLMELTRLVLPSMITAGNGRILNVASIAGFMPGPKMAVYYAGKAFVRSLTEALAVELKGTGCTATALCPGPVKTDFWNRAEASSSSIFGHMLFADSKKVACFGYKKMLRGSVLAVPGLLVKLFALASRLLPRSWVRNLVYMIQK